MAELRAAAAFLGAISAHGMMGRMLLADSGTELAHFDAERAKPNRKGRGPSHPLRGKDTKVGAVATESDATGHQFTGLMILRHVHPDHIVAASVADSRAIQTGLDTVQTMLIH